MVSVNFFLKLYYNWWKNIDKKILFLILLLFGLSLFFSLTSTSLIASEKLNTEDYYFFFKHLIFVLLGFIIIFIFSSLEKFYLIKISKILFILSLILLVIVPFIGVEVKGSKRWLDFLFLPRFQPVEILKPFFIVMVVSILASESSKNIYFRELTLRSGEDVQREVASLLSFNYFSLLFFRSQEPFFLWPYNSV